MAGFLAAAFVLLAALPSSAGPALFSGVGKAKGGIVGTIPATTIGGPTTANPNYLSVTTGGDFTVPALRFDRATPGYSFSLPPVYPYVFVQVGQRNDAGAFGAGYLSPLVPVVGAATNAVTPYVTGTPRAGFLRVVPGADGFGGRMKMDFTKYYKFDIATSLGILKANALDYNDFGATSVGRFAPGGFSGGLCCSTYPSGSPGAAVTAAIGTARGPWVTGMATAYDPHGANITTTTFTGADSRSAFDTGVISLVTPRTQYVYQGNGGGTLVTLRDAFSSVHSVDITMVPEPGHAALLASGLVGLLGLYRRRRTTH